MNPKLNEFRKKLIIETAHEYFKTYGYTNVQVEKIAKELEMGIGTIYSIFGSKEGLFLSWLFYIVNKAYQELKDQFEMQNNPIKQCEIFANFKLMYYEKNRSVFKDYIKNNPFFLKDATRGEDNPMKKIYLLLATSIERLIEKETNLMTKDAYHLAYLLDGIVDSYIEYYSDNEKVNLTSKTHETVRMFLNAIGMSNYEYEM